MTYPLVHLDLALPSSTSITKMNVFKDNTFNDVQGNYVCSSLTNHVASMDLLSFRHTIKLRISK